MRQIKATLIVLIGLGMGSPAMPESSWSPVEGHLMTRWAADVDSKNPWPEYPRPKMVRQD